MHESLRSSYAAENNQHLRMEWVGPESALHTFTFILQIKHSAVIIVVFVTKFVYLTVIQWLVENISGQSWYRFGHDVSK